MTEYQIVFILKAHGGVIMSIDGINGAAYQDVSRTTILPKNDTKAGQGNNSTPIKIVELPGEVKSSTNSQEKKENDITDQQIKDAVSKANNKLKIHRTSCEFSYHEETNRVSIKVIDNDTHETIREIPPEETLEMVQKMWELAGLLVDERR